MAVGALEPQFYAEFVRLLTPGGTLPAQHDVAQWPQLRQRIGEAFASRTQEHWTKVFEGSEACVSPVLSFEEAPGHPHLAGRNTFERRDGVVQPAAAPRFSATPTEGGGPPALPGEHTRQVLADWDLDDADALLATGAVHQLTERSR